MKRLIPTLLLVIICIGGFWYASSQGYLKGKKADEAKPLFQMKAADVQSYTIESGENKVDMVKSGDGWSMTTPSPVPLKSYTADGWPESFAALTYASIVEKNPTDLAEYGLAEPVWKLGVKLADGTTHQLLTGKSLPIAGSSYVKLADSPVVYEVKDTDMQSLMVTAKDFADMNAIHMDYDQVTAISVAWKGQSWKLEKAEADKTVYETKWKIGSKELESAAGTGILDKVRDLAATDLPVDAAKASIGDKPDLTLTISEKKTDGTTTELSYKGKIADQTVNLLEDGGKWAYAVPLASIEEIVNAGK
ncbi:DUF4340 domain-containing protein [Gorillibacterium massiliense]|uniref:DUF4340 domain-containing protein n=1 Tax=Gorillibacterium massiliense TaxID=1280390 RepID=UPI0004B5642E|nr:DUF4340 domain-containing protein [Gorillibacterium massiliense]